MHAVAAQGVQVGRQRGDERLALTRSHFRDIAVVQDHAADELHIEGPQTQRPYGGLASHRESLCKQIVERFAVGIALAEFVRPGLQGVVVERLQALLERIDPVDDFLVLTQQPLITTAENTR